MAYELNDAFLAGSLGEQSLALRMTNTEHNVSGKPTDPPPKLIAVSPQRGHPRRRNEDRQVHGMSQKLRPCIHFIDVDHDARTEEDGIVRRLVERQSCAVVSDQP